MLYDCYANITRICRVRTEENGLEMEKWRK